MAINLPFVKRKPMSAEEQERHQAKERAENIKRIRQERQRAEAEARRRANETKTYEQAKLHGERELAIETQRTNVAKQQAERAVARQRQVSGIKQTVSGAISLIPGVSKMQSKSKHRTGYDAYGKQRPVYISTSHGLKRIYPDDPRYAQYAQASQESQMPTARPPRVQESNEDFGDQPSAFRGL